MSEAQKGGSPIAGSKKKDLLFDEDIGKEFLSSWKSNTGGDDALDFTPDTVSRGRKNTFTLDKLDMDFTFDGGFDKLSSFKVDMSDLDFSSPPRTDQKPKEGSGKESVLGRQEVNKERFSFNFDFKELDGFDLDSTLLKGGERSGKCAIDKEPDCSAKCLKNQDVRNNLEENIAKSSEKNVIGKLPSLDNIAGSKFKLLMGSLGEFETPQKEVAVRIPAQGKFISSHDLMNYPPKQTYIGEEESMREGSTIEQSEIICSKPDVPLPISDSIDQSIPVEDSTPVIVSELKTGLCTSDSEVNTNTGRDQDDTVNSMPSSHFVNNSSGSLYNLKCLPSKYTSESQNTGGATGKLLHDRKDSNVGNQDSVSNVLQLTLHRDSRDENLVEMKGAAATCSNFLDKSEDSQVNLASTAKQVYGLRERKMGITHLGPSAIEESPKSKTNGGQAGNQNVVSSVSDRRAVKKSIPTVLGSERNDKDRDSLRFLSDPARTPEQKSVFGLPKSIISRPSKISSLAPVVNSKTVFIERKAFSPLKTEKMRDISSLKISRKITSNGDTSLSTLQKETKSSASKGIMAVHVSFPSKKAHSITTEKSVLFSPSLKRTSIERLTPDALTLNPLKRAMESPLESRKLCKYSPVMESKMVLEIENIKDTPKNVNFEQPSPILDIPLESSMPGLEVPGLIENDGNVEKAEACAKELENICNMLKKKHEEAKELLVRAVVNNNLLLMLNHPRYEEKIHLMQRYAASLGLKEY